MHNKSSSTKSNDENDLRMDLQVSKEHLQIIIAEKDALNQELWAMNEELRSTNEKLLSVNEELEAAKEELESGSERLSALNEKLQKRNSELIESENRFRVLVESSSDWIWEVDSDGRYTYISPNLEDILGYKPAEIIGKEAFDLMPLEEAKRVRELFSSSVEKGEPIVAIQNIVLHKEGRHVILETSGAPIFDETGTVCGYRGIDRDITRRIHTERAVQRYQTSLEEAQKLTHLGSWEFDLSTEKGFWTKEMFRLFERDPAKGPLSVSEFWETVHPDDRDAVLKTRMKVVETGKQARVEYRIVTPGGTVKHFEALFKAAKGDRGQLLVGTILDVSERKRVREALRERENQLSVVFNNTYDQQLLFAVEPGDVFRMVAVNHSHVKSLQAMGMDITEKDLIGKTAEMILIDTMRMDRDFANKSIEYLRQALKSGKLVSFEESLKWEETCICWEANVSPILEEDGRCKYLLYTSHDITQHKMVEGELRESEARLRNYIESAPDGIFVVDDEGHNIEVNRASSRITGYSSGELLQRGIIELIHPNDRHMANLHFEEARHVGRASTEMSFTRKDDSLRYWIVDTVRLSPTRLLVFTKDITEQKESRQALIESKEQLRQAEKMQAVGQLAGGIAHDFNNQLAALLGYAELIRFHATEDQKQRQFAENIIIGIKRAADLTAQLLAFARKGKYLTVPVDIHRTVFEVANLLSHSIDKRIIIHQHLKARPSTTLGDPTQLQNAVLNLALNARDAMPDGGDLTLATETVELDKSFCDSQSFAISPGHYIIVSVSDTGVGIKEDIRQRIFEPFFTTKEAGEGTGMGLAAVYGTARIHKGAIVVSSTLGCGSTFLLYIPVIDTEDKPIESGFDKQRTGEKYIRILLVEDDDRLRRVILLILENLGHTVSVCMNGLEAIELYRKEWRSIDLVLLDIVMPVLGGKETFIGLRAINPDVVVLLLSGYSLDDEAQSIIEEGAQGFIQKPFRTENLASKISELLHLNHQKYSDS